MAAAPVITSVILFSAMWLSWELPPAKTPAPPVPSPQTERPTDRQNVDQQPESSIEPADRALEILTYATSLIPNLPRPESQVIAYAALGDVLWASDSGRAREAFRSAFATLAKIDVSAKPKDRQEAKAQTQLKHWKTQTRAELLTRIAQRDADLAKELSKLGEKENENSSNNEATLNDESVGFNFQRAYELLDTDPEQAAALAQQTLAAGVSLWLIEFLPALRERAPELADQLFEMALKVLLSQSNPADASQLHLLGSYITPASGNVNPQLARYFLSLMAAALQAQSDPSASSGRRLSLSEQQYLAQSYLPLFERYAPDLTPAIQALLNHISANMPSEQKQQTQPNPGSTPNGRSGGLGSGSEQEPQISSDNIGNVGDLLSVQETGDETAAPEDATASEAVIMRIRDEKQRQALLDARRYNAARKALKQDKLDEAHRLTQQIKDVSKQVDLLVELGQNIAGRNETDRALAFFDQAYQLISTLDDPRIKAFQMLTLARTALKLDRSRAIYYAQGGVTTLNRLHSSERATTDPMAELTRRQATRGQLEAIFAPLGRADFDQAIYLATQLLDTEQRILAEIAICRTVLEQAGKKSNP